MVFRAIEFSLIRYHQHHRQVSEFHHKQTTTLPRSQPSSVCLSLNYDYLLCFFIFMTLCYLNNVIKGIIQTVTFEIGISPPHTHTLNIISLSFIQVGLHLMVQFYCWEADHDKDVLIIHLPPKVVKMMLYAGFCGNIHFCFFEISALWQYWFEKWELQLLFGYHMQETSNHPNQMK